MKYYVITGTEKETGERRIIGSIKNNKELAEKTLKNLKFNNWKDLPEGMNKKDVQKQLTHNNLRIKRIL